ncbi:MAG: hypothetical protein KAS11_01190 [Candidatus Aenigmarchaeota archaeon]|nr:hypothetical protein [Candidatus Aenigmarchaeota archaeon]
MKIKGFGNPPGTIEDNISIINQIETYAKTLELKETELYLVFANNQDEIRKYYEMFSTITPESLSEHDSQIYESMMNSPIAGGYIPKCIRKDEIPPTVLITVESVEDIKDRTVLDELTHIKEDELGWYDKEIEALFETDKGFCISNWDSYILQRIRHNISNYISDEIGCRCNYSNLIFQYKKNDLEAAAKTIDAPVIKKKFSEKSLYPIEIAIHLSFKSALPPSYHGDNVSDEKELDKIISPIVKHLPDTIDNIKLKDAVHSIKIPPKKDNLILCYARVFDIYNLFLDSIFDEIEYDE